MVRRGAFGVVLGTLALAACGEKLVERPRVVVSRQGDASAAERGDRDPEEPHEITCGDGTLEGPEECDDGNLKDGDGCNGSCRMEPLCGDGIVDDGEPCDDGNLRAGDGCDAQCRTEACGNGRVDEGEQCEPGSSRDCGDDCHFILPHCGDGEVQADEGEQCDDANEATGDGCARCRLECGDGELTPASGEECEPLLLWDKEACDGATCRWKPFCGDGVAQFGEGEQCDPAAPGAVGCSLDCKSVSPPELDLGSDAYPSCVPDGEIPPATIENSTFESHADDWTAGNWVTVSHDAGGAFTPGSLHMEMGLDDGPLRHIGFAQQCVPVAVGSEYTVRAQYFLEENDANAWAALSVVFYNSTNCGGDPARVPGPRVSGREGEWTPIQRSLNTSGLADEDGIGALMINLGLAKDPDQPAGVRWDDIELWMERVGCGNCTVELAEGEECDDGNVRPGDGCDAFCQLEGGCGDGELDDGEECDDGNVFFGDSSDTCTPLCRLKSDCDACGTEQLENARSGCYDLLTDPNASGVLEPHGALCAGLVQCAHQSGCAGASALSKRVPFDVETLEHCYCGTASPDSCFEPGAHAANGSCRAEVEAALGSTDPASILERMGGSDPRYPAFARARTLLARERGNTECSAVCGSGYQCGDGVLQDRAATFAADYKARTDAACPNTTTVTGAGCFFEECDDGNVEAGDGCDAHCFIEACGNGILQVGEACDDGNLLPGDGCDESCVLEYECGDGQLDERFEECDPGAVPSGVHCTEVQFADDPSQCGCDSKCRIWACGNGTVQDGEDCDSDVSTCNACVQEDDDACTQCAGMVRSSQCDGEAIFYGEEGKDWEGGCSSDGPCLQLWTCLWQSRCGLIPNDCYCGLGVSYAECSDPSFTPTGPCKDETIAAYRAQTRQVEYTNASVLQQLFDPSTDNRFPSLAFAYFGNWCLWDPPLYDQLLESGSSEDEAARCAYCDCDYPVPDGATAPSCE